MAGETATEMATEAGSGLDDSAFERGWAAEGPDASLLIASWYPHLLAWIELAGIVAGRRMRAVARRMDMSHSSPVTFQYSSSCRP